MREMSPFVEGDDRSQETDILLIKHADGSLSPSVLDIEFILKLSKDSQKAKNSFLSDKHGGIGGFLEGHFFDILNHYFN